MSQSKNIFEMIEQEKQSNPVFTRDLEVKDTRWNLALELKRLRETRGISQEEMIEKTGLTKHMISKLECFDGNPSLLTLLKYLKVLDIDLVQLLETI